MYPNPTSNKLTIALSEKNNTDDNIVFYNTTMQMVKKVKISKYEQSITVSLNDLVDITALADTDSVDVEVFVGSA